MSSWKCIYNKFQLKVSFVVAALTSVSVLNLMSSEAVAQEGSASESSRGFEEVIVTSRKRSESLEEIPIAITAFTSESLDSRNISNLDNVGKYVPNLNITRFGIGNPAHAAVFIRGIGIQDHIITTDPNVGIYVDGVYLGRQLGSNLNLNNVERIEVLRGPQGTLYGRNTIGGAINVITRKPGEEESFQVNLRAGSRFRAAADFYGTTRLADDLAISISGSVDRRDGIGKALRITEDVRDVGQLLEASSRIGLLWDPSEAMSFLFTADVVQGENGQNPSTIEIIPGQAGFATDPSDPFGVFGPEGALDPSDLAADPDDTNTAEGSLLSNSHSGVGTSLTADIELNDNFTTKFIGSYRQSDYTGGVDDDAAFTDFSSFPERGDASQFSMEAQLNGAFDRFDFVSGLYYFREEGNTFSGVNTFIFNGGTFDINQEVTSYAAYAHTNYNITNELRVGGGIRYTADAKDADALFTNNAAWDATPANGGSGDGTPGSAQRVFRSDDWEAITWSLSLNYDLTDDLNAYSSISRGYQNGGFPARPFGGPNEFVSFDPTDATNFEVGLKGTISDFLQFYLSVFHTRYKDLPLQFSQPNVNGFVTITANAGRSESTGVELESTLRLSDAFSIYSTIGYINAEVTEVDDGVVGVVEGETPALTPEWTISIAPEYVLPLADNHILTFQADYSYRSSMFGQSDNNEFNLIDERSLFGFNIKYENLNNDWSLSLYGQNIFNEVYDVARLDQPFSGFTEIIRSNDRSEFGLRFTKNFGE